MSNAASKAKRGTYPIALRAGGFGAAVGWVQGDWAARKDGYFWEVTHIPSGMLLNTYPCLERKADALRRLDELNRGEGLKDYQRRDLEEWAQRNTATLVTA